MKRKCKWMDEGKVKGPLLIPDLHANLTPILQHLYFWALGWFCCHFGSVKKQNPTRQPSSPRDKMNSVSITDWCPQISAVWRPDSPGGALEQLPARGSECEAGFTVRCSDLHGVLTFFKHGSSKETSTPGRPEFNCREREDLSSSEAEVRSQLFASRKEKAVGFLSTCPFLLFSKIAKK